MQKIVMSILFILFTLSLYSKNNLEQYIVDTHIGPDGSEIIGVKVPGGRPPQGYVRKEIVDIESLKTNRSTVIIDDVPAFDWSYGCSATSAAMIAAYYDRNGYPNIYTGPTNNGVMPLNNSIWNESSGGEGGDGECPLSATHQGFDGLSSRGHVDDYWIDYGSDEDDPYITNGWNQHAYADCTGDFMGTNQSAWASSDGSTTFYTYTSGAATPDFTQCESFDTPSKDGGYGFKQFMESRGYNVTESYNQRIAGYEGIENGFTFADYMAEINANRPVLIHVLGHSMVGFGYDSSDQTIYLKNTWDYSTHTMTWGGDYSDMTQYAVTVINLDPNQNVQTGDSFANPLPVNVLPFNTINNTNNYTNTLGNSSKDVFYQIYLTSPANNVTISTNGSSFDTYLRLYNSSHTQIYADNDSGEGNNAQLTGLNFLANTEYYVCVEGNSSENGLYSLDIFVEGLEYLTLECNDSYGDGWSNTQYDSSYLPSSVSVLVNGITILNNFTFDDGAQATTTFGVFPGNTVSTTFSSGDWSNECSYRILDANGVELGAGDDSTDISFLYGEIQTPPTNLSATIVNANDVNLQWTLGNRQISSNLTEPLNKEEINQAQRSLTGFTVYRNNTLIATLGLIYTYTDASLTNANYSYKVTAIYSTGESEPSNTVQVTINMGAPQIVENLEILCMDDSLVVSWNELEYDVNNNPITPDSYNVYASETNEEGSFMLLPGELDGTFYTKSLSEIPFNPLFIKVTAVKN